MTSVKGLFHPKVENHCSVSTEAKIPSFSSKGYYYQVDLALWGQLEARQECVTLKTKEIFGSPKSYLFLEIMT